MSVKKFLKAAKEIKERQVEEKKSEASHDESNWLVSYADMMTLLCGFFIMLFSMAKVDEPKYEKVKEAMSKQFGGNYVSPTKELEQFVADLVTDAGVKSQAEVKNDGVSVTIAFESVLFFETLSAEIKPEGKKIIEKLAKELYEKQQKDGNKPFNIVVEGHTDSRPIVAGSFPSNWELSGSRASRVVRYFMDAHFAPDHLTSIGYADTRPEVNARRPDGTLDDALLAKNRRVVVRILGPDAEAIPLPKLPGSEQDSKKVADTKAAPAPGASAAPGGAGPNASAQAQTKPAPVASAAPAEIVISASEKAKLDKLREERARMAREALARAQEALAKAKEQEAQAKSQAQKALEQAQDAVAKAKAQEAIARARQVEAGIGAAIEATNGDAATVSVQRAPAAASANAKPTNATEVKPEAAPKH